MKIKTDVITSRNNPFVKQIASLAEKKWRDRYGLFIAEGEKLTYEAINAGLPISYIIISESKADKIDALSKLMSNNEKYENCELITVSDGVFEKISTEMAPQGLISVIKHLDFFRKMDIIYKEEFFLDEEKRALLLCSVRDPGNLGSIIRSAVALGIEHLILSCDCADLYNPKTVRSAMGSLFHVEATVVSDIDSFVISAIGHGRRVFAAELREGAKPVSEIAVCSTDIFMIGNEGHGIPEDLSRKATQSVYIPISTKTESLNASVAAAILMWEQSKTL